MKELSQERDQSLKRAFESLASIYKVCTRFLICIQMIGGEHGSYPCSLDRGLGWALKVDLETVETLKRVITGEMTEL